MWKSLSHVWLFATLWTVACQAPLSMEFSRLPNKELVAFLLFPSFPLNLWDSGLIRNQVGKIQHKCDWSSSPVTPVQKRVEGAGSSLALHTSLQFGGILFRIQQKTVLRMPYSFHAWPQHYICSKETPNFWTMGNFWNSITCLSILEYAFQRNRNTGSAKAMNFFQGSWSHWMR